MSVEETIRGLFSHSRIIRVTESKLFTYGTSDEVQKILDQLDKENKVKREEYGFCDIDMCYNTVKLSDYDDGELVECEYGHEFEIDKKNMGKIVYWEKVK